ncbi:MAG: hypothetical protein WC784_03935 [Candidatus Shapirobacteria bacterium]|jgi:hypothetical protein
MKNQNILVVVLVALIFAGAGFFVGKSVEQNQIQTQRTQLAGQFGNRAGGTGNARGGQVLGTILSQNGNSMTVQMTDGSSKIVLILGTTSINQAATATVADLKVGEKVSVFGSTNTDGSVSAQNIQINPIMRNITSGTPSGTPQK